MREEPVESETTLNNLKGLNRRIGEVEKNSKRAAELLQATGIIRQKIIEELEEPTAVESTSARK